MTNAVPTTEAARASSAWRHSALPIALAAAVIVSLYAFSPNFRVTSDPQASPYAGDFLQEWIGGWIVRAGDRTRMYDAAYAYGFYE